MLVRHVATCKQQHIMQLYSTTNPKPKKKEKRAIFARTAACIFLLNFSMYEHFCHSLCSLLRWLLRCIEAVRWWFICRTHIHMDRHKRPDILNKMNGTPHASTRTNANVRSSYITRLNARVCSVCCVCYAALVFK